MYSNTLLIFFTLFVVQVNGQDKKYFISQNGNDSNDGSSPENAWKTIRKVNSFKLQPGDSILFEKGGKWEEQLVPNSSGGNDKPITYSSYGEGEIPLITGLINLKGWEKTKDDNVWRAKCNSCSIETKILVFNDSLQPIGRFPNFNDTNGGYLTIKDYVKNEGIKFEPGLNISNFQYGELVIRKNNWIIDRNIIISSTDTSLIYSSGSHYLPKVGYGFFIQNNLKTLDSDGEWFFDSTKKYIYVYYSKPDIENQIIQVSILDILLKIENVSNLIVENFHFTGGNANTVFIKNSNSIKVVNSKISFSASNAIFGDNLNGLSLNEDSITNTQNNAFTCKTCSNTNIISNYISNTGCIPGMGSSGDENYNAINICNSNNTTRKSIYGKNNLLEGNVIYRTGYIPINFNGDSIVIKNNFIDYFGFVKDDCGGIYIWNSPLNGAFKGRIIQNNVISNGIGASEGTDTSGFRNKYLPRKSNGIYVDDNVSNVVITKNSILGINGAGVFLHNCNNIDISYNNLFNNRVQLQFIHDLTFVSALVTDVKIERNVFASGQRTASVLLIRFIDSSELEMIGSFSDNMYLITTQTSYFPLSIYNPDENTNKVLSFREWINTRNGNDIINSFNNVEDIRFEFNATKKDKIVNLQKEYKTIDNRMVYSVSVKPFTSILLIKQ